MNNIIIPKAATLLLLLLMTMSSFTSCGHVLQSIDTTFSEQISAKQFYELSSSPFCETLYVKLNKSFVYFKINEKPPFLRGYSKLYKVDRRHVAFDEDIVKSRGLTNGMRVGVKKDGASYKIFY